MIRRVVVFIVCYVWLFVVVRGRFCVLLFVDVCCLCLLRVVCGCLWLFVDVCCWLLLFGGCCRSLSSVVGVCCSL